MNKEIEKLLQIYRDELSEITAFTAESKHTNEETLREVRKLKILISALEAQQADMWIPITERLPEIEDEYIVTLESGDVDFDMFKNNKWMHWNGYNFGLRVIAWRNRPNPWNKVNTPK